MLILFVVLMIQLSQHFVSAIPQSGEIVYQTRNKISSHQATHLCLEICLACFHQQEQNSDMPVIKLIYAFKINIFMFQIFLSCFFI